jgi:cytoskeletal protein RodZ
MDHEILKEIGAELKACRRSTGLSLDDVSKKLRIRKTYLEGIESANKKKLPSDVYTIGYLKHYAKLMKLDEKALISRIKHSHEKKLAQVASNNLITEKEFLPSKQVLVISTSLFFMLYIVVYFFFYF